MTRPLTADQRIHREGTLEAYQHGVERSIQVMHNRLGDQLTVDELADAGFMSRFHFSRVFTEITGASPGRFLAAIRMQEAKRLLLKTERSVTDICFDVGYNSLGTFTRIFADSVGFPPVRFRQFSLALLGLKIKDVVRFIPTNFLFNTVPSISGEVVSERPLAFVTVALFPTAIPRSHPIECICLTDSKRFAFSQRLPRSARIFSAGMSLSANIEDAILLADDHVCVGTAFPIRATCGTLQINLAARRCVEPPVVVAFPLLIAESFLAKQLSTLG